MDLQTYQDKIEEVLASINVSPISTETHFDFLVIELAKKDVIATLTALKNDERTQLDFLTTMCGIHFPNQGNREFALMYQLHNMRTNERLRIRTFMPESDMRMPTASSIFPTANWMERQEFDFYGFEFEGHPELKRILNMDEMNYFPMRKQYAVEDAGRTDKDDKYFGR